MREIPSQSPLPPPPLPPPLASQSALRKGLSAGVSRSDSRTVFKSRTTRRGRDSQFTLVTLYTEDEESHRVGEVSGSDSSTMIGGFSLWTKLAIQVGFSLTALALLWPSLLSYLIKQEMELSPGSKSFQHWKETPVPMYIDIYFHNWTNPEDIATQVPHFSQMGPYRFYEKRTKVDLVWNANDTVSYRQTRHWYYDPEHSNGTLQDQVTSVNLVPLTVAHTLRFRRSTEKRRISYAFTLFQQQLHTRKTVQELLFEGYEDHILSLLSKLPAELTGGVEVADKFGWFYQRNGSAEMDGVFNMARGTSDLSQVGRIQTWNYSNKTGYFEGECGEVGGTSGEVYPPYLSKEDSIQLFSGDLCRTISLKGSQEEWVDGIRGLRFAGGTYLVDSGYVDPGTACYNAGESVPLGLLNITSCRRGVPVFISYPHFYLGDEELQSHVGGMRPNKEEHEFSITVEPTFGVPIDLKGRFQVNLMMEPSDDIILYEDVPRRYFMPVLWFDQRAALTPELASEVSTMVTIYTVSTSAAFCLLVTGGILAALGITLACRGFTLVGVGGGPPAAAAAVLSAKSGLTACQVCGPTAAFIPREEV